MKDSAADIWTESLIDPTAANSFHVYDNTDGYFFIDHTSLAGFYADWGSAVVDQVQIAFGNNGTHDGLTHTAYIDDLAVNVAPVPLPAALPLLASGLGFFGFAGGVMRRKRRAAGSTSEG